MTPDEYPSATVKQSRISLRDVAITGFLLMTTMFAGLLALTVPA